MHSTYPILKLIWMLNIKGRAEKLGIDIMDLKVDWDDCLQKGYTEQHALMVAIAHTNKHKGKCPA